MKYFIDCAKKDQYWIETMANKMDIVYESQTLSSDTIRYIFEDRFHSAFTKILNTPSEERPKQRPSLADRIDDIASRKMSSIQSPMRQRANLQQSSNLTSPTETEQRWAEHKMAAELVEIEKALQDADSLLKESAILNKDLKINEAEREKADFATDTKPRKKRNSSGRTNQVKIRLTDAELVQFRRRLKRTGLSQGDFLRDAALTGQIVINEHSLADTNLLDELAMIRAELGRQGGLLKMVIKPNEGKRELVPSEWATLIQTIRDMEQIKKRLSDLEVQIQNGYFKT